MKVLVTGASGFLGRAVAAAIVAAGHEVRCFQRRPSGVTGVTDALGSITEPADVWFSGSRVYVVELDFGKRKIEKLVLDPQRRFPDRNPSDNSWPDATPAPAGPARTH